jgi:hypothetical protein
LIWTDNIQLVVVEVGRIQDILPLALPDLQTGVDRGCTGVGQGVMHDDRMGWIDDGVPSADDAVERIEDQGGRSGLAVFFSFRELVCDTMKKPLLPARRPSAGMVPG